MNSEQRIHKLIQQVSDLEAKATANDAVVSHLLGILLHILPEPEAVLKALRTSFQFKVTATDPSIPSAESDAQIMQMKSEQALQDAIDRIERAAFPPTS